LTRAVFFDVGNTLVDLDYTLLSRLAGGAATAAHLESAFGAAWLDVDEYLHDCYSRGADPATLRYIIESLFRKAGCALDDAAYERLRAENRARTLWRVAKPEARAMLADLRALGVITAVISNADGHVEDLLRELGLLDGFTFVIDSARVGVSKPARRIFEIALETAGVEPGEAAYVGDMPSIDVAGAAGAGLLPILYDPCDVFGTCRTLAAMKDRPVHRVRTFPELTALIRGLRAAPEALPTSAAGRAGFS
jgi:HAD superfamily hydrolase (TIGR01509 family)